MRPALRLAFLAVFVGGTTFALTNHAGAQVTDEEHAECAQGGGFGSPLSGAGESGGRSARAYVTPLAHFGAVISNGAADDDGGGQSGGSGGGGGGDGGGQSGSFLSDFAHRAARSENPAGKGEGEGANEGLGASNLGGGAGGCDAPPRRLPVTGAATPQVAYMGAAFVLAGSLLMAGNRLSIWLLAGAESSSD